MSIFGGSSKSTSTQVTSTEVSTINETNVGNLDIGLTGNDANSMVAIIEQGASDRAMINAAAMSNIYQDVGTSYNQLVGGANNLIQTGLYQNSIAADLIANLSRQESLQSGANYANLLKATTEAGERMSFDYRNLLDTSDRQWTLLNQTLQLSERASVSNYNTLMAGTQNIIDTVMSSEDERSLINAQLLSDIMEKGSVLISDIADQSTDVIGELMGGVNRLTEALPAVAVGETLEPLAPDWKDMVTYLLPALVLIGGFLMWKGVK